MGPISETDMVSITAVIRYTASVTLNPKDRRVAQREFKEVNISQWGKNQKKIDHLRFKSAFSNCFGSESKFY